MDDGLPAPLTTLLPPLTSLMASSVPAADPSTQLGAGDPLLDMMSGGGDDGKPKLGGGTPEHVNRVAICLLIFVTIAPILGVIAGGIFKNHKLYLRYRHARHPPLWVVFLLTASYTLLVPGVVCVLFSFAIYANLLTSKVYFGAHGGSSDEQVFTETMLGLIHLLHKTGSYSGAILVTTYAIAIPAVKFFLLLIGESLRRGGDHAKTIARTCIQIVQNISKWACPDMFAYILLTHLVRGLNHPVLLNSFGRLDLGFTCFCIFCIGSTVATLGMSVDKTCCEFQCMRRHERIPFRTAGRMLGKGGLLLVVVLLQVLFWACFCYGLKLPLMELHLDMNMLYKPTGPIDPSMKEIVESLGVDKLARAQVGLFDAINALFPHIRDGDVNSLISFIMMGLFCVGIPALDMLLLFSAALHQFSAKWVPILGRFHWSDISMIFMKLGMLDVTIVGVYVVTLCMKIYKKSGVVVGMSPGFWWLLAAEVVHRISYSLVKGSVQHHQPQKQIMEESSSEEDGERDDDSATSDEEAAVPSGSLAVE